MSGRRGRLELEDLPGLPPQDRATAVLETFEVLWEAEKKRVNVRSGNSDDGCCCCVLTHGVAVSVLIVDPALSLLLLFPFRRNQPSLFRVLRKMAGWRLWVTLLIRYLFVCLWCGGPSAPSLRPP